MLIGYFTVLNPNNQSIVSRGDKSLIQKLTENIPVGFIMDKKLKDVLFPTVICATYQNERNQKILARFISMDHVINYLKSQREVFKFDEKQKAMYKYKALSSKAHRK